MNLHWLLNPHWDFTFHQFSFSCELTQQPAFLALSAVHQNLCVDIMNNLKKEKGGEVRRELGEFWQEQTRRELHFSRLPSGPFQNRATLDIHVSPAYSFHVPRFSLTNQQNTPEAMNLALALCCTHLPLLSWFC